MKIIIDISREQYSLIMQSHRTGVARFVSKEAMMYAIKNGTPLPKGHGRIVDIGPYEGKVIASRKYCGVNKLIEVAELDTIIDADKGE